MLLYMYMICSQYFLKQGDEQKLSPEIAWHSCDNAVDMEDGRR